MISSILDADKAQATAIAQRLIQGNDFVVLDLCTTKMGESPEIVEMAIVDPSGRALFNRLVRPKAEIPPAIATVHGISPTQIKNSPSLSFFWRKIMGAVEGKTILSYDWERDCIALNFAKRKYKLEPLSPKRGRCLGSLYSQWFGDWNEEREVYCTIPLRSCRALPGCYESLLRLHKVAGIEAPPLIKRMVLKTLPSYQGEVE